MEGLKKYIGVDAYGHCLPNAILVKRHSVVMAQITTFTLHLKMLSTRDVVQLMCNIYSEYIFLLCKG